MNVGKKREARTQDKCLTANDFHQYTTNIPNRECYRSMGTTGDPVPVGQRDVPVNHFTG